MSRAVVRATIDDAVPYIYTRAQADEIIAGYPEHERDARSKGIPVMGSGRIFPLADSDVEYDSAKQHFPGSIKWLGALDFGWDHPTAAVLCAWDADIGTMYVTQAYKRRQATPLIHCGALRPWGKWIPWAWPHDGLQTDKGSGAQLKQQYADNGLKMMPDRAQFQDGSFGVEAGLIEMLDAMQTGHLKVAKHLIEWFDEFRLYHRDNGKVNAIFDDLMSATRYAWMSRRYAIPKPNAETGNDHAHTGPQGWMA